ncbi:AMP-binding protein [Salinactinospora qingdaonensis]|uniref:Acyl-CoA synthetase (AMP-forming)/AMP-acid ligase II n=1 Tax=Salinactinospora qingdaonensis TaxID=702744 RepID=A0ABP7F637_9ACTN
MSESSGATPSAPASGHELLRTLRTLGVLVRAGVVRPGRPGRVVGQLLALRRWGATAAGAYRAAAMRAPNTVAYIDDARTVSYAQLQQRTTRLANGLAGRGVREGTRVGVLCRNHGLVIETLVACGSLGADTVMLNTGLAGQQLAEALENTGITTVIADAEFADLCAWLPERVDRIVAWGGAVDAAESTVDGLAEHASDAPRTPPHQAGRLIMLTSGTTGPPKGARRPTPKGPQDAAAVLSRIPLRSRERLLVTAPLFHTWGLAGMQLAMALRATLVLQRRFDPEELLRTVAQQRCTALFAVPVMLQRIMELPAAVRARYDTSSLRIVACSGSAMPPELTTRFMDAFGDIVYNLYGSTEVSWATIATPAELRASPTTAGRPPLGTRLAILDSEGRAVPAGAQGRIFVGNDMLFEGYTTGQGKRVEHGLMETGDLGHVDSDGLLHVAGRDDDMIVSGGENVFPRPVEEAIVTLPQVREVAVVGVPDEEFGRRFAAYVVTEEGASLGAEEVRARVRERLARFSVPREVHFLDALPRNATGKVLKRQLAPPRQD